MHAEIAGGGEMNQSYSGPERRNQTITVVLTDDQLEHIADRAADKAVSKLTEQVYMQVGKGVIRKLFWIVGVCAVSLYLYLKSKGIIQ